MTSKENCEQCGLTGTVDHAKLLDQAFRLHEAIRVASAKGQPISADVERYIEMYEALADHHIDAPAGMMPAGFEG